MSLLLDTSVFLKLAFAPELVPKRFHVAINRSDTVYLSTASAWEIAIKSSLGKLNLPVGSGEYVTSRMEQFGTLGLDIKLRHAAAVETLPFHHRDPFDRLLIAQAIVEGLTVVTLDAVFKRYKVAVL